MAENLLLQSLASTWADVDPAAPSDEEQFPDETGSERMSQMIRHARKYLAGQGSTDDFLEHLRGLRSILHKTMAVHYRLIKELSVSPDLMELGRRATLAYEQFSSGLAQMIRGLCQSTRQDLEIGLVLCKRSVEPLEEWYAILRIAEMDEQPLVCPRCSWAGVGDLEACGSCGYNFPLEVSADNVPEYVRVPAELVSLFESCRGNLKGSPLEKLSGDEPWVAVVELLLEDFEQSRRALGAVLIFAASRPELLSSVKHLEESLDAAIGALILLQTGRLAAKEDLFDFFDEAWHQMLVSVRNARFHAGAICRALLACLPPVPDRLDLDDGGGEEVSQISQGIP
jgi:hypothetical protein